MLIERLSDIEKKEIETWIDLYGLPYKKTRKADIDYLLRFWNEEKRYLYRLLGENFIISKSISIKKTDSMIEEDFEKAMFDEDNKYYDAIYPFYSNFFDYISINAEGDYNFYKRLRSLIDTKLLSTNVYEGPTFSIVLPNGKPYRITQGHKIMKALSKLASAWNIDGFENFRLAHSQILNEKTFEGDLCLSIHPLDYMTMSDNANGWESCMSWRSEGDYRIGTVEMMNSPYVVVAYMASKNDKLHFFGDYTWNSKKWRELFIVDPAAAIVGIKGYPYWNTELQEEVIKWLAELSNNLHGEGYYEDECYLFDADKSADIFVNDKVYNYEFQCGYMYNDFCYKDHAICFIKDAPEYFCFKYSGYTECMCCGEIMPCEDKEISDCSLMACSNCYEYKYCNSCGRRVDEETGYFELNGNIYCDYCYESLPRCIECDEIISNTDLHSFNIALDDKTVFRDYCVNVCEDHYYQVFAPMIKTLKNICWYGNVEYMLIDDFGKDRFEDLFGIKWDKIIENEISRHRIFPLPEENKENDDDELVW